MDRHLGWHRRHFWPFLIWMVVLGFFASCSSGKAEVQEEDFAMSEEVPMPEPLPPPQTNPTLPPPSMPEQEALTQTTEGMSETMWRCRPHFGGRYRLIRFLIALLLQEEFGYYPSSGGATYDYRARGFRSGSRA